MALLVVTNDALAVGASRAEWIDACGKNEAAQTVGIPTRSGAPCMSGHKAADDAGKSMYLLDPAEARATDHLYWTQRAAP